jgi:putative aminopeptidase FrvX
MTELPSIDLVYLKETLIELLNTPSPTGFTAAVTGWLRNHLQAQGITTQTSGKGALIVDLSGEAISRPRALTAHIDTLGAIVKEIKENGRLRLSPLGGFAWNTVEGEGCTIFPAMGEPVRGALLPTEISAHIYGKVVGESKRDEEHMEARLDIRTESASDTQARGIQVGDFVAFDPRVEASEEGFIRSRHLDDKASAACLLAAVRALRESGLRPSQRTRLHFSTFEEVGHGGASGFPPDLAELVVVDIGIVGQGQNSSEFSTTLCAKDSSGPYHPTLTKHLRDLAEEFEIPYKMDVFPHYASDGSALWAAGGDVQVALFGPGIDASHSYERTHIDALEATAKLIAGYLLS